MISLKPENSAISTHTNVNVPSHDLFDLPILARLDSDNLDIHRVFHAKTHHEGLLFLPNAEDTAKRLLLCRRVPPWINDDDLGSHGEVEAH